MGAATLFRSIGLAGLVASGFVASASSPAESASCDGERIMVVAGSSPAPKGDQSLVSTLEARGGAECVTTVTDDDVTLTAAQASDVVVVTSSVQPSVLAGRLRDAVVPVLVSEPFLFDDMSMVAAGDRGELADRRTVRILDDTHPLAGGLSGTVSVFSSPMKLNYGVIDGVAGAEGVANTGGGSSRTTVFGFAAGAEMVDRLAPAPRVGFFASFGAELTADGRTLLDAAVDWLLAGEPAPRTDGDAVDDAVDNCPHVDGQVVNFNIGQFDTDGDGVGDSCDPSPVAPSSAIFTESDQQHGVVSSSGAELGDLDGDGDLDALVSNQDVGVASRVWLNDGTGIFVDSGERLGDGGATWVDLGDVDGDSDLDAVLSTVSGVEVWINDGAAGFVDSGQLLGGESASVLGDVDGDGDLDIFHGDSIAADGTENRVWINDGSGTYTDSGQRLGNDGIGYTALGDLDADGDLDAFVTGRSDSRVWLNSGSGAFADSGQRLTVGGVSTWGLDLGDLDGDGDLDAYVTTISNNPDQVWLNDGTGTFADSGQRVGADSNVHVDLGDLDGDGDLDAFVPANNTPHVDRVWINDGSGTLTDSGQTLGASRSQAVALGDVDGDHDLDAYVANWWGSNHVWINDAATSQRALLVAGSSPPPLGDRDIVGLIEDAGLDLTVVDDDSNLSAIDPARYEVIFISTSVAPGNVGATFKDAPVPVIVWEGYLFDDMALSASGETSKARTDITIVDPTHPLADGLAAGNHRVYTTAQRLSYGRPAPDAEVVAHEPARPDNAVIFAYDPGDVRIDGVASPALRVGLFPSYPGALELNSTGISLVDAAIYWVLDGGPPGNDDFVDRFTIDGTTATGDNVGATQEDGEPHDGVERSVWWEWTATIDGLVNIDIATEFDAITVAYAGDTLAALDQLAIDYAFNHRLTFAIRAGETYQISIGGRFDPDEQGDYDVNVAEVVRPPNDDFADAFVAADGVHAGTNVGATLEPGEPLPYGLEDQIGEASVWWSWTPTDDGIARIDTAGTAFDTVLGVWLGNELTSLDGLVSDDDGGPGTTSAVEFRAVAGTTYHVAVYGYFERSRGDITLTIDFEAAVVPPNDDFSDALPFAGDFVTGVNTGATLEPGESSLGGWWDDEIDGSMWWTWTAPSDGHFVFDTAGSDAQNNPPIGIWQGAELDTLTLIAASSYWRGEPYEVAVDATAGEVYHLAVYRAPNYEGDVQLNVRTDLPTNSAVNVEGTVGAVDVALDASGHPILAYETEEAGVVLMHCADPNCAGDDATVNVIDPDGGDAGFVSLALDDGLPVVVFQNGPRAALVRCNDAECAGNDDVAAVVDPSDGDWVDDAVLRLDPDGNPVLLTTEFSPSPFFDYEENWLLHCNDAVCAGGDDVGVRVADASPSPSDLASSFAVDAMGHPVLAREPTVTLVRCDDPSCDGALSHTEPSQLVPVDGPATSVQLDTSDNPVVGFSTGGGPGAFSCNDPMCADGDDVIVGIPTPYVAADVIADIDAAGNPVIGWVDTEAGDLVRVARCTDPTCAAPPDITDIDYDIARTRLVGLDIDPLTDEAVVVYTTGDGWSGELQIKLARVPAP